MRSEGFRYSTHMVYIVIIKGHKIRDPECVGRVDLTEMLEMCRYGFV